LLRLGYCFVERQLIWHGVGEMYWCREGRLRFFSKKVAERQQTKEVVLALVVLDLIPCKQL